MQVTQGVRPARPSGEPGRVMSDALWSVVERCWLQEPSKRPRMNEVIGFLQQGQQHSSASSLSSTLSEDDIEPTDNPSFLYHPPFSAIPMHQGTLPNPALGSNSGDDGELVCPPDESLVGIAAGEDRDTPAFDSRLSVPSHWIRNNPSGGMGFPQVSPNINTPAEDHGVTVPQPYVVPAALGSDGENPSHTDPFQPSLETIHQGEVDVNSEIQFVNYLCC